MPGSRARPSISGSSVVPGLPNITETPSLLRIWRNACLPEMSGIGPNDNLSGVALPDSPLLRAARRLPVPFTPVWLMRQAGRYLPEYRAMRARHGFLELCKSPAAAAEVTLQPVERLGVDAAILFADILLVLEPLGVGLEFVEGEGPRIHRPLRSAADVAALPTVDVGEAVGAVFETVRLARKALAERVPLIGFAGAPFTLASYLIEGGPSREFLLTKRFMRAERRAWEALMSRLSVIVGEYLNGQIAAGAQAVQLFDSWVGTLSPSDYREFVQPWSRESIRRLTPGTPVIHFGVSTAGLLPLMKETGGDVLGLDWRVELGPTWDRLGHDIAVQGNLDPAVLLSNVGAIRRATQGILDEAKGRPGHIFNLGHGVHQETPVENVKALVDIVHELSSR